MSPGLLPTYFGDAAQAGPPESLILRVPQVPESQKSRLTIYPLVETKPAVSDRENAPVDREKDFALETRSKHIQAWLSGERF